MVAEVRRLSDDLEEVRAFIDKHELDAIALAVPDLHGIARGKKIPARRILESDDSPMRLSNLMVMVDYAGIPHPPPENDDRWWPSWSEGYADTRMVIDPGTRRLVPWQERTGLLVGDLEHVDGRGDLEYLPRATLKRLVNRLQDMGFVSKSAIEMEFMLFNETSQSAQAKGFKNLDALWNTPQAYSLTPLDRHDAVIARIRNSMEAFGLPIETWSTEGGPGQLEMNLAPSEALASADRAFLFKHALKELAAAEDMLVTFIPKLSMEGFGNATQLNLSLWRDGANAFHDPDTDDNLSTLMKQFVAGIVTTLREFTLLYAPTINAYRRFVPYYSSGFMLSWGYDNKSNTVRCVTESPSLTRLEQRTAGGDANPYLMLAAALAAGLYGVDNELEAPPPVLGDAYSEPSLLRVPATLDEAIELFEQSEITNAYLGEDFVRFFAHSRRIESACFREAMEGVANSEEVTDWELARYFEIV